MQINQSSERHYTNKISMNTFEKYSFFISFIKSLSRLHGAAEKLYQTKNNGAISYRIAATTWR